MRCHKMSQILFSLFSLTLELGLYSIPTFMHCPFIVSLIIQKLPTTILQKEDAKKKKKEQCYLHNTIDPVSVTLSRANKIRLLVKDLNNLHKVISSHPVATDIKRCSYIVSYFFFLEKAFQSMVTTYTWCFGLGAFHVSDLCDSRERVVLNNETKLERKFENGYCVIGV